MVGAIFYMITAAVLLALIYPIDKWVRKKAKERRKERYRRKLEKRDNSNKLN